jgi:hypothetical protein
MLKLIIEIPLEANDLQEEDFSTIVREAVDASGIHVMVGRPINDETMVSRTFELSAENFSVRVEE